MTFVTTRDEVQIFYKDWGPKDAQPIVFHHGWPLCSDDWDAQMLFFAGKGYRVIAHDRRGHGRSDPPVNFDQPCLNSLDRPLDPGGFEARRPVLDLPSAAASTAAPVPSKGVVERSSYGYRTAHREVQLAKQP